MNHSNHISRIWVDPNVKFGKFVVYYYETIILAINLANVLSICMSQPVAAVGTPLHEWRHCWCHLCYVAILLICPIGISQYCNMGLRA